MRQKKDGNTMLLLLGYTVELYLETDYKENYIFS